MNDHYLQDTVSTYHSRPFQGGPSLTSSPSLPSPSYSFRALASKAGSPPVMENLLHNLNLPRPPQPSCSTFNTSRRNDPSFPPIKMLLDSTPCPTTSIAFSRTSSCFWFLPFSVYLFLSMRLKMLTLSLIVTKPSDSCLPPAITLHSQYFLPLILYLLLTPLEKEKVTHSSILAWRIP